MKSRIFNKLPSVYGNPLCVSLICKAMICDLHFNSPRYVFVKNNVVTLAQY